DEEVALERQDGARQGRDADPGSSLGLDGDLRDEGPVGLPFRPHPPAEAVEVAEGGAPKDDVGGRLDLVDELIQPVTARDVAERLLDGVEDFDVVPGEQAAPAAELLVPHDGDVGHEGVEGVAEHVVFPGDPEAAEGNRRCVRDDRAHGHTGDEAEYVRTDACDGDLQLGYGHGYSFLRGGAGMRLVNKAMARHAR